MKHNHYSNPLIIESY